MMGRPLRSSGSSGKADSAFGGCLLGLAVLLSPATAFAEDWQGAHANGDLVRDLRAGGLSADEAGKRAADEVARAKSELETAHPGLKDGAYSYDCYQDFISAADGQDPNCFGDVAFAGDRRWEPTSDELEAWLNGQGYKASSCDCECGLQKVAVFVLVLRFRRGAGQPVERLVQPIHIAEQLEDCTWRSRMGDLGVVIHRAPEQLWSEQPQVNAYGQLIANRFSLVFGSAQVIRQCYSKPHARKDFHTKPGGPLQPR